MKPLTFLLIAGDPSGDLAAADLARALQKAAGPVSPRLVGAGGPAMKAAGVELAYELTGLSVIGLEILGKLRFFHEVFHGLLALAGRATPDAVIGVDYAGLNLRLAGAIRRRGRSRGGPFHNWNPRLVQYISPQVWASRAGRARVMERNLDLLLSILPFEPEWFARHAPRLRVEFVGHPLVDRRRAVERPGPSEGNPPSDEPRPLLLLLPGSRPAELRRHLPVMVPAAARVAREAGARLQLVLPNEYLRPVAAPLVASLPGLDLQVGGLDDALRRATVAMASTGTVLLECAWFGVPTVALYKTSPLTYQVAKRMITVRYLAMPNLLAGEAVIPEFVQDAATPEALAGAALELLGDAARRANIRARLTSLANFLGAPGASHRAAQAILGIL